MHISHRISLALGVLLLALASLVQAKDSETDFIYISLVNLITQPEQFDSKNVSTAGFLAHDANWLFLTESHATLNDLQSGLPLLFNFSESDVSESGAAYTGCEHQMVRVYGHLYLSSGHEWIIRDVSSVEIVDEAGWTQTCWKEASNKSFKQPEAEGTPDGAP